MLGIGSGSLDPETLVILETAFDEAWITLKNNGSGNIRPNEARDESAISRWKESVIPCDCMTGRLAS
jgi:hypothetical protein